MLPSTLLVAAAFALSVAAQGPSVSLNSLHNALQLDQQVDIQITSFFPPNTINVVDKNFQVVNQLAFFYGPPTLAFTPTAASWTSFSDIFYIEVVDQLFFTGTSQPFFFTQPVANTTCTSSVRTITTTQSTLVTTTTTTTTSASCSLATTTITSTVMPSAATCASLASRTGVTSTHTSVPTSKHGSTSTIASSTTTTAKTSTTLRPNRRPEKPTTRDRHTKRREYARNS